MDNKFKLWLFKVAEATLRRTFATGHSTFLRCERLGVGEKTNALKQRWGERVSDGTTVRAGEVRAHLYALLPKEGGKDG